MIDTAFFVFVFFTSATIVAGSCAQSEEKCKDICALVSFKEQQENNERHLVVICRNLLRQGDRLRAKHAGV